MAKRLLGYLDPNTSLGWNAIQIIEAGSTHYYQANTYSGVKGGVEMEMRKGIARSSRVATGETSALENDANRFIVKETFQDGTYTKFTLDDFKNPTRIRDRLTNRNAERPVLAAAVNIHGPPTRVSAGVELPMDIAEGMKV